MNPFIVAQLVHKDPEAPIANFGASHCTCNLKISGGASVVGKRRAKGVLPIRAECLVGNATSIVSVTRERAMASAIVFMAFVAAVSCADWHYNDEAHWPDLCRNGKEQSPIDIEDVKRATFDKFVFLNYTNEFLTTIKNNGHSVQVNLHTGDHKPAVKGGGLLKEYVLDHLHFHWGSEHTIMGRRYPLEIHLVHYAKDYGNLSHALNHKDGVAVLGVLCELSPDDDRHFEPLIKFVELVEEDFNQGRAANAIRVDDFLPRDVAGFYRYDGSLTTPGCNEVVTWTLFSNTIPISKEQVHYFEEIKAPDGPLLHNYRPIQALGSRTVYFKESPLYPKGRKEGRMGPLDTNEVKGGSSEHLEVSRILIMVSLLASLTKSTSMVECLKC